MIDHGHDCVFLLSWIGELLSHGPAKMLFEAALPTRKKMLILWFCTSKISR
jgi:hypothetical protein